MLLSYCSILNPYMLRLESGMDFGEISFPYKEYRLYRRPTNLTPFPLSISALTFILYKNNAQFNICSVSTQFPLSLHRHSSGRSLSTHPSVHLCVASFPG